MNLSQSCSIFILKVFSVSGFSWSNYHLKLKIASKTALLQMKMQITVCRSWLNCNVVTSVRLTSETQVMLVKTAGTLPRLLTISRSVRSSPLNRTRFSTLLQLLRGCSPASPSSPFSPSSALVCVALMLD